MTFKALLIKEDHGVFHKEITSVSMDDLPSSDLLIKVSYSSINYKDALSAAGNKGVTRKFPHVPGVDAAGTVIASSADAFPVGSKVLVTGFDLGMNTWGGFGQYIRIPADWAILLPDHLSERDAMCFGTAGLTAGLSVYQLLQGGLKSDQGKIAVSGASGGVGSIAVAILAKLGYEVSVITGKDDPEFFLDLLGAKEIIHRDDFVDTYDKRALSSITFAGGIDTVGGTVLSAMLKSTRYGGTVTCCGMVGSTELHTSVFPFILRGLRLIGIDSVELPLVFRKQIWQQLADSWKPVNFDAFVKAITLEELAGKLEDILEGKAKGRFLLKHDA